MSEKYDIPNLSDEIYYYLNSVTYRDKELKRANKDKKPLITEDKRKAFYVDKIKKDPDTGLDVYVFVQAKKKEGKWIKPKEPENEKY